MLERNSRQLKKYMLLYTMPLHHFAVYNLLQNNNTHIEMQSETEPKYPTKEKRRSKFIHWLFGLMEFRFGFN